MKRDDYFSLSSVHHYLLVDPDGPPVVHYTRHADDQIVRAVVHDGSLALSLPLIEASVAELFAAP